MFDQLEKNKKEPCVFRGPEQTKKEGKGVQVLQHTHACMHTVSFPPRQAWDSEEERGGKTSCSSKQRDVGKLARSKGKCWGLQ